MISLGYIIGIIFCLLWGIISIGVIVYNAVWSDDFDKGFIITCAALSWIASVVVLGIVLFPFDMQYHSYKPVSGKIESIDKRILPSGKSIQEKYAVRFEGDPQIYGCEDTRCSVAKVGDTIKLNCIRAWEYAGEDGYDCKYNQ